MQEKDLSTFKTFKRLFPTISQYKWGLIVGAVALVLNALVDSGLIYLLKPLLDEGFGHADHGFFKIDGGVSGAVHPCAWYHKLYCELLLGVGVRQSSDDSSPQYFPAFDVYACELF